MARFRTGSRDFRTAPIRPTTGNASQSCRVRPGRRDALRETRREIENRGRRGREPRPDPDFGVGRPAPTPSTDLEFASGSRPRARRVPLCPRVSAGSGRIPGSAAHGFEELRVRLGRLETVDEELHGPDLLHRLQELSQDPDSLQLLGARVRYSSRRVPDRLKLIAGKIRFSWSFRSRWISLLPVPLNSS